jgi:hypothetical protein
MRSTKRGAETPVYLASSPEAERLTGQFFANRKPKQSHDSSYDTAATARLWQVSADMVGRRCSLESPHVGSTRARLLHTVPDVDQSMVDLPPARQPRAAR